MSKSQGYGNEFKVGLTVLVAGLVLLFGIFWGKGLSFDQEHKRYYVQFPEVYGLKEGSSVLVQGVANGKVGDISLNSDGALVEILVDKEVTLHKDARVMLFTPQLMGGRLVSINPGNGPGTLEVESRIAGEVPSGIGEVMATSGQVLAEVNETVQKVNMIVSRVDSLFIQTQMVTRIDSSLGHMTSFTGQASDDLRIATEALRVGAVSIQQTSDRFAGMINDNQPRFDTVMVNLASITSETEMVSRNLGSFTKAINEQEGTLGKLIYDQDLHNRLVQTLADLDSLIVQLKEDGVNVSIF